MNAALLVAVQAQPAFDETLTLPVPPALLNDWLAGEIV